MLAHRRPPSSLRPFTSNNIPLCADPLISADGRLVVFQSTATNLVAQDTNANADIFARDLLSNTTVLVSTDIG